MTSAARPPVAHRSGALPGVSYVLPLRRSIAQVDADLAGYVAWLSRLVEVVIADGSPPDVFSWHRQMFGPGPRHIAVTSRCLNGKVAGVTDGVLAAGGERIVVADDDVRYGEVALREMAALLDHHDVVRPQNYFHPLPWHARWDSARTLINRAWAQDYPGTLGLRRSSFLASGGYCGAVLFENLELLRTMAARGFPCHDAADLFVRRVPPDTRHFVGQRVRQAYDSLAQPGRLAVELCMLPAAATVLLRTRPVLRAAAYIAAGCAAGVAAAERGRRRSAAGLVFPWTSSCWAPAWMAERAVCSWLGVLTSLRGGVAYGGARLATAAHSTTHLASTSCAGRDCGCQTPLTAPSAGGRHRREVEAA